MNQPLLKVPEILWSVDLLLQTSSPHRFCCDDFQVDITMSKLCKVVFNFQNTYILPESQKISSCSKPPKDSLSSSASLSAAAQSSWVFGNRHSLWKSPKLHFQNDCARSHCCKWALDPSLEYIPVTLAGNSQLKSTWGKFIRSWPWFILPMMMSPHPLHHIVLKMGRAI